MKSDARDSEPGGSESMTVLDLAPDLGELERVKDLIERFQTSHGLPPDVGQALMLVVEELLVNIISYGNLTDEVGCIRVALGRDGDVVVVELRDKAAAYDPFGTARPDLSRTVDDAPIGGLGVHLVRHMTDRQEYRREGEWNVTRVYKILK